MRTSTMSRASNFAKPFTVSTSASVVFAVVGAMRPGRPPPIVRPLIVSGFAAPVPQPFTTFLVSTGRVFSPKASTTLAAASWVKATVPAAIVAADWRN